MPLPTVTPANNTKFPSPTSDPTQALASAQQGIYLSTRIGLIRIVSIGREIPFKVSCKLPQTSAAYQYVVSNPEFDETVEAIRILSRIVKPALLIDNVVRAYT
jgi:hypothetical protein